ncbi:MAG: ABC transporter ATP-binding protein [Pseudomonadota bacterium]
MNDKNGDKPLLRVDDVSVRFGGIVALDGVSFDVRRGEVRGLIGPNGAGKSTLFNCLSRLYRCDSGSIHFDGQVLSEQPRHRIAGIGVGRTFQNLALFRSMTVRDNVLVGTHSHHHAGFLRDAFRLPGAQKAERAARAHAETAIELLGLQRVAHRTVGDLPFGTQKRVELARALASEPSLLLLDEPACGLNHEELSGLGELILDIRTRLNLTVLLVEHHMGLVMGVCDRIVALNFGKKIADGTPAEVRRHPEVIRAYLGDEEGVAV